MGTGAAVGLAMGSSRCTLAGTGGGGAGIGRGGGAPEKGKGERSRGGEGERARSACTTGRLGAEGKTSAMQALEGEARQEPEPEGVKEDGRGE